MFKCKDSHVEQPVKNDEAYLMQLRIEYTKIKVTNGLKSVGHTPESMYRLLDENNEDYVLITSLIKWCVENASVYISLDEKQKLI